MDSNDNTNISECSTQASYFQNNESEGQHHGIDFNQQIGQSGMREQNIAVQQPASQQQFIILRQEMNNIRHEIYNNNQETNKKIDNNNQEMNQKFNILYELIQNQNNVGQAVIQDNIFSQQYEIQNTQNIAFQEQQQQKNTNNSDLGQNINKIQQNDTQNNIFQEQQQQMDTKNSNLKQNISEIQQNDTQNNFSHQQQLQKDTNLSDLEQNTFKIQQNSIKQQNLQTDKPIIKNIRKPTFQIDIIQDPKKIQPIGQQDIQKQETLNKFSNIVDIQVQQNQKSDEFKENLDQISNYEQQEEKQNNNNLEQEDSLQAYDIVTKSENLKFPVININQLIQENINSEKFLQEIGSFNSKLQKFEELVVKQVHIGRFNLEQVQNEAYIQEVLGDQQYFPKFISFISYDNKGFILTERIKGCTIQELVEMNIEISEYLIEMIEQGIDKMHSKDFAHCDLKPENIMINLVQKLICILDFGLSQNFSRNLEKIISLEKHNTSVPFVYYLLYQGKKFGFKDFKYFDKYSFGLLIIYIIYKKINFKIQYYNKHKQYVTEFRTYPQKNEITDLKYFKYQQQQPLKYLWQIADKIQVIIYRNRWETKKLQSIFRAGDWMFGDKKQFQN